MATLFFNNAVDTSLNTLGNWWTDFGMSIPAGSLPTSSDDIDCEALDINTSDPIIVGSGTCTCDGGVIYCEVSGGTFNNTSNITIDGSYVAPEVVNYGIFNGPIIITSVSLGGLYTGESTVTNYYAAYAFAMFTYKINFPDWATVQAHSADGWDSTCAISWDGGVSYRYPATNSDVAGASDIKTGETNLGVSGTYDGSDRWTDPGESNVLEGVSYKANSTSANQEGTFVPNYPDAEDVRDGVSFGDEQTGFLDLPAESDVRSGVSFDDNTQEGTLGGGTITITVV